MFSRWQAQTGKRVYGGTSQAPNRGQVSAAGAQGYIKRELRNKNRAGVVRRMGSDGQSDNRSSIAAQALQRQRNQGRPIVGHPNNQGGPKPPGGGGTFGGSGNPLNPLGGGGGQQGGTVVPSVQVNANGILELPYNQDFAVEQLAAINDANNQLLGIKMEGDQQALEYGAGKRNAQLAYDNLQKQTLAKNAAGGTAFSSMYGQAVAGNATGFANQMGDLEQANTNFLNNQSLQQATIQSSLNQQLAALAQQYANDLNDQAGTLGYGRATAGTSKPQHPNRKRRRKNRGKK